MGKPADYQTTLGRKMVERAEADALAADHELRTLADEFESAAVGFSADKQTVSAKGLLGAWARATRAWSEYTGEPLI
ncbi:peptidylprolyl isomerase [Halomonas sp. ISL-60]|uniref:peptidylprolyl isomerase n=1 Tax=Halomonas sp. ISL-56 TaxID=2819149 RepID=UPI001BEA6991|nr:peptidylprolyl isomerase [Halomonas sp. ISL-56]MBT2772940.1 peptidylprolyl isomerase [Halomonas sp. ISL-60]MBT2799987.1 peptidylprolyl isomerase [Halomonas sp. ISL-56]